MEKVINLADDWESVREKIKEINPDLSDSDLDLNPGREDDLFERLAVKLNKTKSEIKDWIVSVASTQSIAG